MKSVRHLITLAACLTFTAMAEDAKDTGFVSIFDGTSLKGWHPSAKSGHSRTSGNTSGGRWVVEDGAITGSQDI
ncbi:MAG: hypothetical protein JWO89_625, partial [Verrucomicrobiaceae bacterium]|nr:hypothetical protein [Verrucomicrobiaceae bacterium]